MDFVTANLGADIAGETIVPHFDLVAMGLETVEVGKSHIAVCDTTAIKEAMKRGLISVSFTVDLGSGVPIPARGTLNCFVAELAEAYQGSTVMYMNGIPLLITVQATDDRIVFASAMSMPYVID